ncbi:hypothetical protein K7C98_25505 [Nannocystis pusilla]|uniref:Outer membrane protein beta-barrel domain-containing protein n=1 Tax=Nannocystis pusilla TaxID=889268 RepID=A0ABS7TWG9_9BACT|nr:hypothetical protein [Nannocystis pusilla]
MIPRPATIDCRASRRPHSLLLFLLAALLPACMSYGPPVRSPGYGAPGRIRQGQLEIGGAVAHPGNPGSGGPFIGYGLRDWASIEIGADFSYRQWALGYLGGRFTYAPKRDRKLHGALDGELGVGGGAGGQFYCPQDPCADARRWTDRAALGGYVGGGAGYHFSFFALYARGRFQATAAEGLPSTLFGTLHGGMQFRIARHVDIFASGGLFGLHNSEGNVYNPYWDVGLSVYFDVLRRKQRPAARAPHRMSF